MQLQIDFPGGMGVDAHFNGFTVRTDQAPTDGGDGAAPTPFAHFLASIGTCAGIYVLGFLRNRGLATEGSLIRQSVHYNRRSGMVDHIELDIDLPGEFPEHYRAALIRAVEQCTVKKHLESPPSFTVRTSSPVTATAT